MAKKEMFDASDGVWRTINGQHIFIREGQSLASAMRESGKFSRVARNKGLYKKEQNTQERKSIEENKPAGQKTADLIKESGVKTFADEIKERDRANELKQEIKDFKKDATKPNKINNANEKNVEEVAKEISESKKNYDKYLSKKSDSDDKVDLIDVGDGKYLTIRKGESKEDVMNAYIAREKRNRENLEPEVSKNLRDPRRLWDNDLVDTYIEMNERGLFEGKDKDRFTRDMKTMSGEPLYGPDRIKAMIGKNNSNSTTAEEKSTTSQMNNILRQKAYQKYLKEHPNSKMTFNEFKDMKNY